MANTSTSTKLIDSPLVVEAARANGLKSRFGVALYALGCLTQTGGDEVAALEIMRRDIASPPVTRPAARA